MQYTRLSTVVDAEQVTHENMLNVFSMIFSQDVPFAWTGTKLRLRNKDDVEISDWLVLDADSNVNIYTNMQFVTKFAPKLVKGIHV